MGNDCDNLVSFAEGELEAPVAHAFRVHLASCEACQVNLVETLQLSAHLSELGRRSPRRSPGVFLAAAVLLICALALALRTGL